MNYQPVAADLAVRLTRATAGSARPDAPVRSDRTPRRPGRAGVVRTRLAADLRTVARWIEPAARPGNACQNG